MSKAQRIVVIGLGVAILLGVAFVYINNVGIKGAGTISLEKVPEGATIFLDNKKHSRVKSNSSVSLSNLLVGTHTVVVAKDGYWPWSKKLTVANSERVSISPFLVSQNPVMTTLKKGKGEYDTTLRAIRKAKTPSESEPLVSLDGTTEIWISSGSILAKWIGDNTPPPSFCFTGVCDDTLTVLPANESIGNIAFLPDRNDVIIFSAQNGIFAIEIDRRGTQNFQPIYLGKRPRFTPTAEKTLAILDNDTLFLIRQQ